MLVTVSRFNIHRQWIQRSSARFGLAPARRASLTANGTVTVKITNLGANDQLTVLLDSVRLQPRKRSPSVVTT